MSKWVAWHVGAPIEEPMAKFHVYWRIVVHVPIFCQSHQVVTEVNPGL